MRPCPASPRRPAGRSSHRRTTIQTTSGPWARTSSRERCSPRTGTASSPCRSARASGGSRHGAARSCRSTPSGGPPGRSAEPRAGSRSGSTPRSRTSSPAVRGRAIRTAGSTAGSRPPTAGLHALGWAHSVEAWDDEGLAGGLYGVSIGGLFAAESMFYARTGASKAAFVALVERLRGRGRRRPPRARRAVAHAAPRHRSARSRSPRAAYRARLAGAARRCRRRSS